MSYLVAEPGVLMTAASDLAGIRSTIDVANTAASFPTTNLLVAAEDEVSAAIAALFSSHGQEYQALTTQMAGFHDRFVQAMTASAGAYALAEAANANPLQTLEDGILEIINTPTTLLLGRKLIGDGTSGAAGTGADGGAAGILCGNGGNGGSGANGAGGWPGR